MNHMKPEFHAIHFVGIKGVGVSALALVAKGMGYQVTGSDTAEEFITDAPLKAADITPQVGFAAEHVAPGTDLVVVGAAYGKDNPEVIAAKAANIPVWTYSELLGYLSGQKKTVAVAGTHGKTTTTSLLAYLLHSAGHSPSYVIGTGQVVGLPAHGAAGTGEYFVTEADDYMRAPNDPVAKFLDLSPYAAIITSIEHDHPDMYPSLRDVVESFYQFAMRVSGQGFLVVNADDPQIKKLQVRLADRQFITYGFDEAADYRIEMVETKTGEPIRFRLMQKETAHGPFEISLHGQHNIANAAAAITTALRLGVAEEAIIKFLPNFTTVERRYQLIGSVGNIVVIDDYAHHPTSVQLTLETAKKQFAERPVWCFFQSHTYSRTKALLKEFGTAFTAASVVIVTDIFASAREAEATITTQDLVAEIGKHHKNVMYVPKEKLLHFMEKNLPQNAVAITMGAGDIYKIGREYVEGNG